MRIPTWEDFTSVLSFSPVLQRPLGNGLKLPDTPLPSQSEIPGGSPFSLCEVSRPTDLFDIASVELDGQPVYIDDAFMVHLYGSFRGSFTPNATIDASVDCGSHCEEYGAPPGERPGEATTASFCEMSMIEQPLGGREKTNVTCPPGWYNFTFDAKTAEGERIYCLTTEVCLRWEDKDRNKHCPPGHWNNCRWPR
ncbi:hypothetical protein GGR53DRAFT_524621 [Hypoxylon sp. FL1150]|nr:hypothetical protein GGR53DRAFT_524621 [Hypoxylon sp. FL1150]